MNNEVSKPRWSLRRGLVALIVNSVLMALLYLAFTRIAHFGYVPSVFLAVIVSASLTGWLLRPFRQQPPAELASGG